MSKFKVIVAATALGAATAFGSVAVADTSTTLGVNSAYVFRGITVSDSAQVWGQLDYSNGGAYAGAWLANDGLGQEELDLYGGYNFALGENVSLDAGGIYYTYPSTTGEPGNNGELYLGLNGSMWSLYVYNNFGFDNGIEDDESMYISASVSVGNVDLRAGTWMGTGDAFDGLEDDSYVNVGATFNQDLGDFGSASLSVDITDIDEDHSGVALFGQNDQPQFTVGWAKSFGG